MHTIITIAAMAAIFAAHVVMMMELRPRGDETKHKTETKLGETL